MQNVRPNATSGSGSFPVCGSVFATVELVVEGAVVVVAGADVVVVAAGAVVVVVAGAKVVVVGDAVVVVVAGAVTVKVIVDDGSAPTDCVSVPVYTPATALAGTFTVTVGFQVAVLSPTRADPTTVLWAEFDSVRSG